jgi:cytochrome c556
MPAKAITASRFRSGRPEQNDLEGRDQMNWRASAAILAVTTITLSGCSGETAGAAYHGDDPLPSGMTVKQQIEARQHDLKDMAGAFKTVNDQLKTGTPQLEQIRLAAQEIKGHAEEIANWFPSGTGPESGVKTEALPTIWSDSAGFSAAAAKLREETSRLSDIATTDNVEAIRAQAQATGGACKNCHQTYRVKKE